MLFVLCSLSCQSLKTIVLFIIVIIIVLILIVVLFDHLLACNRLFALAMPILMILLANIVQKVRSDFALFLYILLIIFIVVFIILAIIFVVILLLLVVMIVTRTRICLILILLFFFFELCAFFLDVCCTLSKVGVFGHGF